MPVDSRLLKRIAAKLGVTDRHVHRLIEQTASKNHLTRELASLHLGSQHGLPIHRFATAEQLAELRGIPVRQEALVPQPMMPAQRAISQKAKAIKPPRPKRDNSIFVVHGRNLRLREDIYAFLRAIGLFPMEWDEAIKGARGGANPIIGTIIHDAMKKVQGVMVLLSADELAKLKSPFVDSPDRKQGLHKLGAHSEKTILVQVDDIREISDIAGKHMVHLSGSPASRKSLAQRLKDKLKFKVNLDGTTWLEVGNFDKY